MKRTFKVTVECENETADYMMNKEDVQNYLEENADALETITVEDVTIDEEEN